MRTHDPAGLDPSTALAWEFFERLNRQDVVGAFALMTDDGTFWSNGTRRATSGRTMARHIAQILEYVPITMSLVRSMSDGDVVVLECESEGISRDSTAYQNVYAFWIQLRDGKIEAIHECADTLYGSKAIPAAVLSHPDRGRP